MENGALQFTFAIITDTHIRPPGSDESSPFPVNDLANGRARYAVAAIARHAPAFTIHLGDMVHPLPHLPTYGAAADEALDIFRPLGDALHFVPGNHDIGDKPMAGSPAGPVTDETESLYGRFFGQGHHGFDHGDVRMVVINSSLAGSGSELEARQHAWLEAELAANVGKRIFLFSHYPPFINSADEPLHYDNYEPESRAWLLGLLKWYDVEAVFSGHVHQFFYNRHGTTKLYCLPPTSFIRQDYSELYPVEPALEYGRNDEGKFSYALVDVYEQGYRLRVIPTEGRTLEAGEAIAAPDPVAVRPARAPLTVHLRHAWAQAKDLPYNGPMEEFGRKRARDDYVLMRLWQMGITTVRTPMSDLLDPVYGPRVQDFAAEGIRFCLFHPGIPDAALWQACLEHGEIISAVEFVSSTSDLLDLADGLAGFDGAGGPPVLVSKFHSSAHEPKSGSKFAHSVSPGFKWEDRDGVLATLRQADKAGAVAGVAFQLNLADDLESRMADMDTWAAAASLRVVAVIRLAHASPAVANFDDEAVGERVRLAVETVSGLASVDLQLDTFADIDRSYHPRHGLVDRRSNFRAAGRWLAGQG
ncbi:MAG: metallophosphoesterase [Pseudomonadota bacterium]